MKQMTDSQFDALVREAVQRREVLDGINTRVVKDIRRMRRRALVRKWGRIAAFSFGLPLVLFLVMYSYCTLYAMYAERSLYLVILLLPAAVMVWAAGALMSEFHAPEV